MAKFEFNSTEEFYAAIHQELGIEHPCKECGGFGRKAYGSTSTWRGGVGGQTITSGPCDKCWGSGDEYTKWPSHRALASSQSARLSALEEAAKIADGAVDESTGLRRWPWHDGDFDNVSTYAVQSLNIATAIRALKG